MIAEIREYVKGETRKELRALAAEAAEREEQQTHICGKCGVQGNPVEMVVEKLGAARES
jgi:hypothetical protein